MESRYFGFQTLKSVVSPLFDTIIPKFNKF